MSADLSKLVARPTGQRRHTGSAPNPSKPTVKSRDFARDTSGAGAMQAAIAEGLQSFKQPLQNLINQDHQAELHRIEQENLEYARTAKLLTQKRPDDVKAAQRSGDWSAFGDTVTADMLSRKAFVENAHAGVGAVSGRDAALDPGIISGIAGSTDPDRYRRDVLDSQIEGMDPLEAEAFTLQFMKDTEPQVTQRREMQLIETHEAAVAVQQKKLEMDLVDGVVTFEEWEAHLGGMARAGSLLGAKGQTDAVRAAEFALLDQAAEQKPWATRLASHREDGKNDGLSLIDRHKDYWTTAQARVRDSFGQAEFLEEKQLAGAADLALIEGEVALAHAQTELMGDKFGRDSTLYRDMRRKIVKAQAIDMSRAMIVRGIANREWYGNNSDHKNEDAFINENFSQLMVEEGADEEDIPGLYREWVGQLEGSTDFFTTNSRALMGPDKQARDDVLQKMKWMDKDAHRMFPKSMKGLAMRLGVADPSEYDKILEDHLTAERGDMQPDNAMNKSFGLTTTAKKREFLMPFVEEAVNASGVTDGADTTFGARTPGDALDPDDPEEISLEFWNQAEIVGNRIAYDNPNLSAEQLSPIIIQEIQEHVGMDSQWIDGALRGKIVWRDSRLHVGVEGKREMTRNPDATYHQEHRDWSDMGGYDTLAGLQTEVPTLAEAMGGAQIRTEDRGEPMELRGLVSDEKTNRNLGTVPLFEAEDGSIQPETYVMGSTIWVHPKTRDSAKWGMLPEATEAFQLQTKDEDVPDNWVPLIFLPGHGAAVGDRHIWENENGSQYGTLRHIGEDKRAKTAALLDADRAVSGEAGITPPHAELNNSAFSMEYSQGVVRQPRPTLGEEQQQRLYGSNPANPHDAWALIEDAETQTRAAGEFMTDFRSPGGQEFHANYHKFLKINEGPSALHAYDDDSGKQVIPGRAVVGKRTIGAGYNMDDRDWMSMADTIGITPERAKRIFNGEDELTTPEADEMDKIVAQETARLVYEKYSDIAHKLDQNAWIGLMSLWHHGVGANGTPLMDAALRENPTNWAEVAFQIRKKSMKNFKGTKMETAIQHRRNREAAMVLGSRIRSGNPTILSAMGMPDVPLPKPTQ
jgi:hypothetical protein